MRYAVDLGNSSAKAAQPGGAVVRLPSPADPRDAAAWRRVADDLVDAIRGDAARSGAAARLRVASVVPEGSAALSRAAAAASLPIEFIGIDDVPLDLALTPPVQIGIDRLLAAWFAYQRFGVPARRGVIAVSLGTALTLTCVDRSGRLLGGAIAPAPALASRALADGAAALPHVAIYDESPELAGPIGADTATAIGSGILRGARGALTALIHESAAEMAARDPESAEPAVVLSGGAALAGWCSTIVAEHRDADLVIRAIEALPTVVRP